MHFTGDLRRQNFAGQDLRHAIFHNADLYRARFDHAQLEEAVFAGCFVAEASFEKAMCQRVQAAGSNFYRSCLRSADLTGALFWDCVLAGADLRGATIRGITLTLDCNTFEEVHLSRTASAQLAYLFGRARSAHRQGWMEFIGERDLAWLNRLFGR